MSGRRYGRMRLNIEVRQYVGIREGIRRPGSRSACSEGVRVGFVRHGHEPLRVCSIQQFASIRRPAWDHEELETRAFVPLLLRHPPSMADAIGGRECDRVRTFARPSIPATKGGGTVCPRVLPKRGSTTTIRQPAPTKFPIKNGPKS